MRLPCESQTGLNNYFESPCELTDIPAYGGNISSKLEDTFRVAVQNINGMNLGTIHLQAEEIDAIENLGIDVLGLVEKNIKLTTDVKATLDALT